MYVLLVGLKVKAGQEQALHEDYAGPFTTAISSQEGFRHVFLLRPNGDGNYVLTISFESQSLQEKWVASELHGQVWSLVEGHLVEFTVNAYTAV